MEEIKNRLAEALRIRGLLPVELAKQSGINKGTISRYLKGTVVQVPYAPPSKPLETKGFERFLFFFGCHLGDILKNSGQKKNPEALQTSG